MIIDSHIHYIDESDYLERLIQTMDELGIDKVCMSGLGFPFAHKENRDVADAFTRHPERVVGMGYLQLGKHGPADVRALLRDGFGGFKIHIPADDYDSKEYYPIYAAMEESGLPVLFHTGIVTVVNPRPWPEQDVSSARMRPILLDPVARAFPGLNIIMAHIGVPWYKEACEMARFLPNIYLDISGGPMGFRKSLTPDDYRSLLWWPGALNKMLFGSDVHYSLIAQALEYDRRVWQTIGADDATMASIFGGTMARLLGLDGKGEAA